MPTEEEKKAEQGNQENEKSSGMDFASILKEALAKKDAQFEKEKGELQQAVKDLTLQVVNGRTEEDPKEQETLPTRDECAKKLSAVTPETSNLTYWTNFIETRDATIRETGKDPCLTGQFSTGPNGQVQPAFGEAEEVNKTMTAIKELIAECDGDDELFKVKFAQMFR